MNYDSRPLSTVDNTRDYARVSHSRQWSNYNNFKMMLKSQVVSVINSLSSVTKDN